jgi:hypothetical protein
MIVFTVYSDHSTSVQKQRWAQCKHCFPFLTPSHWADFVKIKEVDPDTSYGINKLQAQHLSSSFSTSDDSVLMAAWFMCEGSG